ncbi:MAG: hypothetical protein Q7S37_04415 [bacterium]|nr:hypothetical protein [bacterium]
MTALKMIRQQNRQKGQALLMAITILGIMLVVATAVLSYSEQSIRETRHSYRTTMALSLAEAGIDYGIRQLNLDSDFTGTSTPIQLGAGEFEVSISGSGITRELTSSAYIPQKTSYQVRKRLRADINVNNINIHFPYGVQAGEGGVYMAPNSKIIGDIYSNGSVEGTTGNSITGTAIVANDSNLLTPIEWTTYNNDFTFGQTSPVIDIAQSFTSISTETINKISLYLKKVGNPSDIAIRVFPDLGNRPLRSTLVASGTLSSAGITTTYSWAETSINNNLPMVAGLKYWIVIDSASDSNNYWQIGTDSSDGYIGNSGMTSPNWDKNPTPTWNDLNQDFNFRVFLGNSGTYIKNVDVTDDAYAHLFSDGDVGRDFFGYQFTGGSSNHDVGRDAHAKELSLCHVKGDAYADNNLCWVDGNLYPGSGEPDRSPANFPITAANIEDFKTNASVATYSGNYTPPTSPANLGPIRINGDLNLINSQYINITGTVYVTGKINFANNNVIALDPGYGTSSGIIITDQPATIANNVTFQGSGQPNTYVLVISTSNSTDPANPALDIRQNVNAAILFAPTGLVYLANNVEIKETTGYKLYLNNNARVTYELGLENVLFSTGPAGGWRMKPGTWREIT